MNITRIFYIFFLVLATAGIIAFFRINSGGSSSSTTAKSSNKKTNPPFTLNGKNVPFVVDSIYLLEVDGTTPSDYTLITPKGYLITFGERSGAMVFENRSGVQDTLPEIVPRNGNINLLAQGTSHNNRYLKIHSEDGNPGQIEVEFTKN